MANKRSLRKYIECVCGEIAAECIIASNVIEGIDRKAMEQQVVKVALMQESALRRVGVTLDRRPCDFEMAVHIDVHAMHIIAQLTARFSTHCTAMLRLPLPK